MPKIVNKERFQQAVEKAELAFWEEIAKAFPEVKTGDMDPIDAMMLTTMIAKTVNIWLRSNYPKELWEKDEKK